MAKPNLENPLYKLPNKPTNLGGVMWIAVAVGLGLLLIVGIIATQYSPLLFGYQDALNALFTLGSVREITPSGGLAGFGNGANSRTPSFATISPSPT